MALPTPAIPVFIAGFAPQTADMNALIQSPFQFCTDSVNFRCEQTSGQAVAASTLTVITFNSVLEDPYSGYSSGTGAWTAPFSGNYEVLLTVGYGTVNGTCASSILVSGTTQYTLNEIATPSTNQGYSTCSFIVPMIGGLDFIQGQAFASASTNLSTAVGLRPSMEIKFISI
jgi:hypothetical protein